MKKIFLSIVTIYMSICCNAQSLLQKEYAFSAGVSVGYDLGSYFPGHTSGFDIFAQADYIFSEEASLTLNVAYTNFRSKSVIDTFNGQSKKRAMPAFITVPVVIGMKCNFAEKYYFHPQVGVAFGKRYPWVAGSYGLAMGIMPSKHADFSIRYQALYKHGATWLSFMGLRVGYMF